jgi:diadenosine tetraphosphatase ApaH/serine/threonine PP2A family protein phosphatase
MRVALLTDIHANREALAACLDHAARHGIERKIFLGDYVGYGADPEWAVDTVIREVERGALALRGNHDDAILVGTSRMNHDASAAIAWTRPRLDATQREFLAQLPLTIEQGDHLYVHASAHAPREWDYVIDLYAASQSLAATRARITFCGHTHIPALFHMSAAGKFASFEPAERVDIALTPHRRWLAVIGSVGQPRDRNPAACYAMLDDQRNTLTYVRVPYDVESAARKIRDAGLPIGLSHRLHVGH